MNDFPYSQKSTKMTQSIDPGAPKVRFWNKKLYFGHPFGIDFSTFSENGESVL